MQHIFTIFSLMYNKNVKCILSLSFVLVFGSCEDFIQIEPPQTELVRSTVFTSDATAIASVVDIYYQMVTGRFSQGGINSVTFLASLSSDELLNFNAGGNDLDFQQFNDNSILPTNAKLSYLWSEPYLYTFKANAVLEGLGSSTGVTETVKNQLLGEAKFIRAFSSFYLVNLFGDVPVVLTTDYDANSRIPRTPTHQVYQQIINDLKDAQLLLADDYSFSQGERIRPNRYAATALLSRVYLYTEDWANADIESTKIINNSTLYGLEMDLNNVFLKNSREAIWQLQTATSTSGVNTWEAEAFIFSTYPIQAALKQNFVTAFEVGDERAVKWIGAASDGVNTYYYPFKYKVKGTSNPTKEYSMVFRLAEQYLIRAEARAQLNKLAAAISDLDLIRKRAKLNLIQDTNPTISKSDLLLIVESERRSELFVEWGHRWLDLKRTNRVNDVLTTSKPNWVHTSALYPIPQVQILNDPNMKNAQNPGY